MPAQNSIGTHFSEKCLPIPVKNFFETTLCAIFRNPLLTKQAE